MFLRDANCVRSLFLHVRAHRLRRTVETVFQRCATLTIQRADETKQLRANVLHLSRRYESDPFHWILHTLDTATVPVSPVVPAAALFEYVAPVADSLTMYDPVFLPHISRDKRKQAVLFQSILESGFEYDR